MNCAVWLVCRQKRTLVHQRDATGEGEGDIAGVDVFTAYGWVGPHALAEEPLWPAASRLVHDSMVLLLEPVQMPDVSA